jgi:signal peptidase II
MKYLKYYLLTLAVIAVDQAVKLWVHANMLEGEIGEIKIIGDFFKLHYTTNPGMAFGFQLDGAYGKLFLSSFRLLAMVGIAYYLYSLARREAPQGLLWAMGLILGGAIGNVIDSTFYGASLGLVADNATTPWFHGMVIDMFYFDLWKGTIPEWFPVWGGQYTSLWPIFNVADASIFIGVSTILLFQRTFFSEKREQHPDTEIPAEEKEAIPENPMLDKPENLNQSTLPH